MFPQDYEETNVNPDGSALEEIVQSPASNSITGRMWILQVPDPDNPVKVGSVKVSMLSFEGYADANAHCLLKDGHGNIVFETYGNVDLSPIMTALGEHVWLQSLTLVDLTSGRVVVHVL